MDQGLISASATLIVGIIALIVYKLKLKNERKNAAAIIVMDIRHAEQIISTLLEKQILDRTLKDILIENNWEKYKHLFASYFSNDEFAMFNRFFVACSEISDARQRMIDVFYASLIAKARISQERLLSIADINSEQGRIERQNIIDHINKEDFVFEPTEPRVRILSSLQSMTRPSETRAFEKLKNLAAMS
ncbi:hypothetical protein NMD70_07240 [Edwardsiella tarda]|uniref:hypothetical protein n=1 Tax=Edwardsiella tarda TaxID=636 RepID=UPI00351C23F7